MKKEASQFIKAGEEKLKQANEELYKPKENVVSYAVCKTSQHAIKNYLIGFLLKNNVKVDGKATIDSLLMQCIKINSDFKNLDFTEFNCTDSNEERHCNSVNTVSKCYQTASIVDALVKKEKVV